MWHLLKVQISMRNNLIYHYSSSLLWGNLGKAGWKRMGGAREANFSDYRQREHMNYKKYGSYPEGEFFKIVF